jgi:hypothetical protein
MYNQGREFLPLVTREEAMPNEKNGGESKALKAMLGNLRSTGNEKTQDAITKAPHCNSSADHQLTAK